MNKQDVMRGWVYVITNQAMSDIVKIGYSSKYPSQRTLDLNHTGAPHPYTLEFDALVINPVQIEQKSKSHFIAVERVRSGSGVPF